MSSFLDRRLVIVAGKGGVGRTTVAAALARIAARRGLRVLLAQTRAKDPMHLLLGGSPVDAGIARLGENLWAVNMTPQAALREYGLMILRFAPVYRAVFENRFVRPFLRAVPGLDEYSMLGKVWYHTTEEIEGEPRFDTVILDGPATGHLLQMLRIPRVILDTVPASALTRDAGHIERLLEDPQRTAVHIVTLPEEIPTCETLDLRRALREMSLPLGLLVVNGIYPDHFPEGGQAAALLERLAASPGDAALAHVAARARLSAVRRRMHEHHVRQLAREADLPRVELPYLFVPRLGPAEVARLAELLEPAVAGT